MTDTLDTILNLADNLRALKQELQDQDLVVIQTKAKIRQLEEIDIPQLMDERCLQELRLASGHIIKVGDFIQTIILKKPHKNP